MTLNQQLLFLLSQNEYSSILFMLCLIENIIICVLVYKIYFLTKDSFYKSCLVVFAYLIVFIMLFNSLYLLNNQLYFILIAMEVLIVNPKLLIVFYKRLKYLNTRSI